MAGKFQRTYFNNPLFRFLSYGSTRSLIANNESLGHVGLWELYLIRSMVQGTPIHLGCLQLLFYFDGVWSYPPQRLDTETLLSMSMIHWSDGMVGRRLVPTPAGFIPRYPINDEEVKSELDAVMGDMEEEPELVPYQSIDLMLD
ncbi:hypothetical protein LINGRAPRIM_LOCUS656 [Linum grandiflorum]